MIRLDGVTKVYGHVTAVDHLTVDIKPGVVTGFLGPNGAGKTTTMRLILGLDAPTSGSVEIDGAPFRTIGYPLREVGALLDARAVHPSRTARNHLRALAASNDIPRSRVEEVLEIVGLKSVANRRAGKYSLGMSQRLGIAAAILGDPDVLLFDEPVNGLDPEGIRWVRDFCQALAREGRTVLVSSHLMSEMAITAEEVIVIGKGRLIRQGTVDDLTAGAVGDVLVRTPQADDLARALRDAGATITIDPEGGLIVRGRSAAEIGDLAADRQIRLHELTPQRASLEDVFMELTADAVEFSGASTTGTTIVAAS